MTRALRVSALVLLAAALGGCGDDDAPASGTDAGSGMDARTGDAGAGDAQTDDDDDAPSPDGALADTATMPADTGPTPDDGGPVPPLDLGPAPDGGPSCDDRCAFSGGIRWGCETRFAHGINYAWHDFGGDFGGVDAWGVPGVAASRDTYRSELADMRAHGATLVRWWVLPDFRGDGIELDDAERATGLGGSIVADLEAALELAEETDTYLMLCLFSFDAFRPSESMAGVWTPGISPMVRDAEKRRMLLDNVVRPLARAAGASPRASRLLAWDVINEPEWAMVGDSPHGDMPYDPGDGIDPVTPAQMESFVSDVVAVLRAESRALVTVGGAAAKWAHAWTGVALDLYQLHVYDWIDTYWPYGDPASTYGLDRPVMMGEFPLGGLARADYATMLAAWYSGGYAGALGWHYAESDEVQLEAMRTFSAAHACETSYGAGARVSRPSAPRPRPPRSSAPGRRCRYDHRGHPVCAAIR